MAAVLFKVGAMDLRLAPAPTGDGDEDADGGDEIAPMFSDVWLGTEVWPAARALVDLLNGSEEWRRQLTVAELVVDLGAGTGACGLAAATLGAPRVLLTDKPALLPALRANALANGFSAGRVDVEALSWAEPLPAHLAPRGADVVLMSDCLNPVYGSEHALGLASTLHALLLARTVATAPAATHAPGGPVPRPVGLLAQTQRGDRLAEAAFFAACGPVGLRCEALREVAVDGQRVDLYRVDLGECAEEVGGRSSTAPAVEAGRADVAGEPIGSTIAAGIGAQTSADAQTSAGSDLRDDVDATDEPRGNAAAAESVAVDAPMGRESSAADDDADVPDELLCPITYALFRDPVVAADGRTYELHALLAFWRRRPLADFVGGAAHARAGLRPAHVTRRRVRQWLSAHTQSIPDGWDTADPGPATDEAACERLSLQVERAAALRAAVERAAAATGDDAAAQQAALAALEVSAQSVALVGRTPGRRRREFLGVYDRCDDLPLVAGRFAYRQRGATHRMLWFATNGFWHAGWSANLGEQTGWLIVSDSAPIPEGIAGQWEVWDRGRLWAAPQLRCVVAIGRHRGRGGGEGGSEGGGIGLWGDVGGARLELRHRWGGPGRGGGVGTEWVGGDDDGRGGDDARTESDGEASSAGEDWDEAGEAGGADGVGEAGEADVQAALHASTASPTVHLCIDWADVELMSSGEAAWVGTYQREIHPQNGAPRLVNGRCVYACQHAPERMLWWCTNGYWHAGLRTQLGQQAAVLIVNDAALAPHLVTHTWLAHRGGAWKATAVRCATGAAPWPYRILTWHTEHAPWRARLAGMVRVAALAVVLNMLYRAMAVAWTAQP